MFLKLTKRLKPITILVIIMIIWLFLPVIVKSWMKATFYEFQAPASTIASYVRDLQDYWGTHLHSKRELIEAGEEVVRKNRAYQLIAVENRSLSEEVRRLEQLLQLPTRPEYRYEIARVSERDFNSWWQQMTIRKGKDYGIEIGSPVVFSGGVVGRVRTVHQRTSVVDLISSAHQRLSVVIEDDSRVMLFNGHGAPIFGFPQGRVEYVPNDIANTDPKQPRIIMTSGMGGVFPPGLKVGLLQHLSPSSSGLFLSGTVSLDKRLMSIKEVAVLLKVEGLDSSTTDNEEVTPAP